jgi:hypothetical protein
MDVYGTNGCAGMCSTSNEPPVDISPGDVVVEKVAVELNDSKLYSPTTSKLDADVVKVRKPLPVPGVITTQKIGLHCVKLNSESISRQVMKKALRGARKVVTLTNFSWDTWPGFAVGSESDMTNCFVMLRLAVKLGL